MRLDLGKATVSLVPGQLLKLKGAKRTRVTCLAGEIWITQEGSGRDEFVSAGESVTLQTEGLTLIEAFRPSSVGIETPRLRTSAQPEKATVRAEPA